MSELLDRVRQRLATDSAEPTPQSVAEALRAEPQVLGTGAVLQLLDDLRRETRGTGPLESIMSLPGVTDVLVNGADAVYFDRGQGLERSSITFADDDAVRRLGQRLASQAGRRLDDASPWVDARLPDGTRLHVVLAPLARPGTTMSLRIPSRRTFAMAELVERSMLSDAACGWLDQLMAARAAFVVSGGTGSGKTTLLAALLGLVDSDERLVVVEDSTELRPDHPHVVGLEARPANVEGAGAVTVRDLVRQALRMRPDRLVVGEVRGAEVVDLLAALNTGHEGGCGTIHANAAAAVPARMEALGVAAGQSREAVHSQMASSLDVVIHVGRDHDGTRRLREIAVIQVDAAGLVRCTPALGFETSRTVQGPGFERLEQLLS